MTEAKHESGPDDWYARMLEYRGVDEPCLKCAGSGVRVYGSTATWRGGIGGQAVTQDVCDHCWGTGDAHRKGADLRRITAERQAWEAEQCAEWLARRSGAKLSMMRAHLLLLADVVEREARKRKPVGVEPGGVYWYARSAESLAATIRELAGKTR